MNNDGEAAIKLPKTHPYIATLMIDPADWHRFEQMADDRPEIRIRKLDQSKPDQWIVYIACASNGVCGLLERAW